MNNSLVKEAENIINQYIRENRYIVLPERHKKKKRLWSAGGKLLTNTVINMLLLAGVAFLIFAVCRLIGP